MPGIFGAWVAAVALAVLGERLGKRGAAIISMVGFFAVSALVVLIRLVEPLTAARLRDSSRGAQDLFLLTTEPIPAMLIGAVLVLAGFGPFVLAIRGDAGAPEPAGRREPGA